MTKLLELVALQEKNLLAVNTEKIDVNKCIN